MTPIEEHEAEIAFIVSWAEIVDQGLAPCRRRPDPEATDDDEPERIAP